MQSHDFVVVEMVWFVLLFTDITATITQEPSNAVAGIGMQVTLTGKAHGEIDCWFLSKDGTPTGELIIVGPDCSVNSPFDYHYRVESFEGGTTCNLIVFNITMEQAGVYRYYEGQNNVYSILTVIENSPTATYNTTENVVVENENVIITCSLNHNGSVAPAPTLRPYFYWKKHFNGRNVSSSYDSTTENTTVSQITVTAGRQNITSYTCHVQLRLLPPTTPNYAGNIPTVDSTASSPTIEVLYGPRINIWSHHLGYIIAIGGTTCEVGVLSSFSTGNPPPSYEWFDTKENVSISNDRTLDLAEIKRNYTCTASNTIRNEVHRDYRSAVPQNRSSMQYCRFPRNESTWISVRPVEGCDNGTCACSSGNDGFTLTCNANSYPSALYQWIGADDSVIDSQVYQNVTLNGAYRCTTYFDRVSSNYTGNVIFPNGTSEIKIAECFSSAEEPEESEVVLLMCIVIGAYILGNIIATVVFLIYYNRNIGFRKTLNDRFSWIKKMLPCMNDDVECKFGWIFLSVCVFWLVGILFTIYMVVIANCSRGPSPKRSEDSVSHFHNPSDLRHPRENQETVIQNSTLGSSGYNTYEEIEEATRLASQHNNRENKGQKIRQNAKENWQPKTIQPPPNADNRTAFPTSQNPHNEVPQHQQPTTAYGPVYSELLVANHNIQPVQYIEGNTYNTNYSELKTT